MTRSELIKKLSKRFANWSNDKIAIVVDSIFDELSKGLANEQRVELRGFGSFAIRKRDAREARNPKTNEVVQLGARKVVYFRVGKELREYINS
jgi:integration host factor subunit beta